MEGALPNPLLGSCRAAPGGTTPFHPTRYLVHIDTGQGPGCVVNSLFMEGGRDQGGDAQGHNPVWPSLVQ